MIRFSPYSLYIVHIPFKIYIFDYLLLKYMNNRFLIVEFLNNKQFCNETSTLRYLLGVMITIHIGFLCCPSRIFFLLVEVYGNPLHVLA